MQERPLRHSRPRWLGIVRRNQNLQQSNERVGCDLPIVRSSATGSAKKPDSRTLSKPGYDQDATRTPSGLCIPIGQQSYRGWGPTVAYSVVKSKLPSSVHSTFYGWEGSSPRVVTDEGVEPIGDRLISCSQTTDMCYAAGLYNHVGVLDSRLSTRFQTYDLQSLESCELFRGAQTGLGYRQTTVKTVYSVGRQETRILLPQFRI